MNKQDLNSMTLGQLYELHDIVVAGLSAKIVAEKAILEVRLRKLGFVNEARSERRPYPKVLPKYRNPKNRGETWAGRGKQPRWLTAQLESGRKLSDFLIA